MIKKIPGMNEPLPGKHEKQSGNYDIPVRTLYRGIFIAHIPMFRLM